jgi:hypothetical protein
VIWRLAVTGSLGKGRDWDADAYEDPHDSNDDETDNSNDNERNP